MSSPRPLALRTKGPCGGREEVAQTPPPVPASSPGAGAMGAEHAPSLPEPSRPLLLCGPDVEHQGENTLLRLRNVLTLISRNVKSYRRKTRKAEAEPRGPSEEAAAPEPAAAEVGRWPSSPETPSFGVPFRGGGAVNPCGRKRTGRCRPNVLVAFSVTVEMGFRVWKNSAKARARREVVSFRFSPSHPLWPPPQTARSVAPGQTRGSKRVFLPSSLRKGCGLEIRGKDKGHGIHTLRGSRRSVQIRRVRAQKWGLRPVASPARDVPTPLDSDFPIQERGGRRRRNAPGVPAEGGDSGFVFF